MIRSLRTLPIKHKLILLFVLTTCFALVLACITFAIYEQVMLRRNMASDIAVLTDIFDDPLMPGVIAGDTQAVSRVLQALNGDPHVLAAAVYHRDGRIFANYERKDLKGRFPFPSLREDGTRFQSKHIEGFRRMPPTSKWVGSLYIAYDLDELSERLWHYAILVTLVVAAATLAAFILLAKLHPIISGPISHLAHVASAVARDKDYSIRAVKESDDELGGLVDSFNEMLGQIQQQDHALQEAHNSLEKRVADRTAELAASLSVLNATIDSTADGILAVKLSGEVVCYNRQFVAMWGIPPSMLTTGPEVLTCVASQLTHPAQFIQRIEDLKAAPEHEAFDVLDLKDGRTFERFINPQRLDGQVTGMVINFRDITERKRADARLESVHKQLLETSRHAGMAEVATGVLHNVGNVLNSVNVSANLISDTIRKSQLGNLPKVAALLREHETNLGSFLSDDPKGKKLPGYIGQLSDHLSSEQQTLLKEMELLRKNIEHIKDIVAMQQSYAKVSGVSETLKITDLVDDALRLNAGALTRHQVQLIREYEAEPTITIDKHKVLQILVNLVRNAKYACDDSGRADKKLTVRVSNGNESVRISIIDNGIGIPPENLTRIFNHGFTTRKEGHGFGLHSGALAAKELGGALAVQSDGPGKGASFTLELPLSTLQGKTPSKEQLKAA